MRDATAGYRREMDVIGEFFEDCCVTAEDGAETAGEVMSVTVADLYDRYEEWCQQSGSDPVTKRTLGTLMGERGYRSRSVRCEDKSKRRVYLGIRLRGSDDPEEKI